MKTYFFTIILFIGAFLAVLVMFFLIKYMVDIETPSIECKAKLRYVNVDSDKEFQAWKIKYKECEEF